MRIRVRSSIGNIPMKNSSKWFVGKAVGIIFPMRFYLIVIYWKEQKNSDSVEHCNLSSNADIYFRKIYQKKNQNTKTKNNLLKAFKRRSKNQVKFS